LLFVSLTSSGSNVWNSMNPNRPRHLDLHQWHVIHRLKLQP
jgi:hypothetical protein